MMSIWRRYRLKTVVFYLFGVATITIIGTYIYSFRRIDYRYSFQAPENSVDQESFHGAVWSTASQVKHVTTKKPSLSLDPSAEIDMEERRSGVLRACRNLSFDHTVHARPLVSWPHHFLYCPVEKTASTFWRRFFFQLVYTKPMKSPFDVTVQKVLSHNFKKFFFASESGSKFKENMASLTKLLFVRDPYSRLFSAYVDKLLAPNPIFWKQWGKPAVEKYRNKTLKAQESTCGHDVTFSEFVSHVTATIWNKDPHLNPIYRLCSPCDFNFTVIGKMETFLRDTRYLMSFLNISESQIGFERMEADASFDAIEDSSKDSLSTMWVSNSMKCVSKEAIVHRIIRKLQIRGFISWRYKLTLTPYQIMKIDSSRFIQLMTVAQKLYPNTTELKIQKKQAFLEAFRTLRPHQFDEIRKVYAPDFSMFGYRDSPSEFSFTSLNGVKDTHAFDWRKEWNLSAVL